MLGCNKIKILYDDGNKKITTCESFKNSLIELNASENCGIDDKGLIGCNKLKILNAWNNKKITKNFLKW